MLNLATLGKLFISIIVCVEQFLFRETNEEGAFLWISEGNLNWYAWCAFVLILHYAFLVDVSLTHLTFSENTLNIPANFLLIFGSLPKTVRSP